jgi:CelD/BcsL family acetyltransferase involved in cellulose biosynthesis
MQLQILTSANELRQHAAAWDRLWRRSLATTPTCQSEPLAVWIESFAPTAALALLVVRDGDQWLATLPLVEHTRLPGLSIGRLPNNEWALCGDLAIEPQCDVAAVCRELASGMRRLGWPLAKFDGIRAARADWQALLQAIALNGLPTCYHDLWEVGEIAIAHDWQRYLESRSRNLRRQIKRSNERLQAAGDAELKVYSQPLPHELESLLRRGFEVEQRSWKSDRGSAVLQLPDVFDFYCRQASALAATGSLELVYLNLQGRSIAFEYGLKAKGVYFSPKVGYDEEFADFSPGQQLRARLYQEFQRDPARSAVDFHGPLAEATAKWATGAYRMGRLLVGLNQGSGRALVEGYRWSRRGYQFMKQRLRRQQQFAVRPLEGEPAAPVVSSPELESVGSA